MCLMYLRDLMRFSCSSFNLRITNNEVRKWFENRLLRDSFSQASRWICAFVSKVVMYFKPKYTLKPKYSFWNLSLLQGLPSLLTYLFLAYPNPNFTPKWISGPITVASIWLTTVGCGKCCCFFFFFLLRLYYFLWLVLGFPGGSDVKNLPAVLETQVWSTGQEGLLEEEMTTHSSIPAWIIPWLEEPRRV